MDHADGMAPRITIVGGGSTHWTPKLLIDFANTPSLCDADVVLMDIDGDSLKPMLDVAAHIAARREIPLTARATTDLDDAADGADVVIAALTIGGFASMRHDIELPARYGLRQPVGDSVGPGGIARALRSVPVVVDIAQTVARRSPDALFINVSNPLTALCRAVTRETPLRTVGLCNELVGLQFVMSLLFDAGLLDVDPEVGGVNHFPLCTSLRIGGQDGFAMLDDLLANPDRLAQPVWMEPPAGMHYRKQSLGPDWTRADVVAGNRLKLELFRRFRVLPGASDTHISEFLPPFVTARSDFGREWAVHQYGLIQHQVDKRADDVSVPEILANNEISAWPSGELVAALLAGYFGPADASGAGKPPAALPVNLPNDGQVTTLPAGVVVECMGVAAGGEIKARDRVAVTGYLGEQLRRVVASQELTVEAALTGSRRTALEAMLADPYVGQLPYEDAVALTDELLAATAAWLPRFATR
jgi:alpha-galactosidase